MTPVRPAEEGPGTTISGARRARFLRRHRRSLAVAAGVLLAAGFVYFVVPKLIGLGATVRRLRGGDPKWLAFGAALEALSLGGYIALFRTVFSCHGVRIGWKASYQITMAGVLATKLFAAAGAGGVALTVWALRASGLRARTVARRLVTFELLLYSVYAGALIVAGLGLSTGLIAGGAPWTLTILPAAIAVFAITVAVSVGALPGDLERRAKDARASRRVGRLLARLAVAPWAVRDAIAIAIQLVRERRPSLLGALAYWGFDIATLWTCFHAFGTPPPLGVIIMAYFVGTLVNALPLPGGLGGVEGGMIGAFLAFGAPASLALLAVLSYRAISFWLPTLPGAVAYLQLRRTVARWKDGPDGPGHRPVILGWHER
jgi:putative heme transporter